MTTCQMMTTDLSEKMTTPLMMTTDLSEMRAHGCTKDQESAEMKFVIPKFSLS